MKVRVTSPTRVDLAGGFLDIWPVYALVEDCLTVNCSIPVSTSASIEYELHKTNSGIVVESYVVGKKEYSYTFVNLESLLEKKNPRLLLLQKFLHYGVSGSPALKKILQSGCVIKLCSESPIGGGLGASSSLAMSLLKLFSTISSLSVATHAQRRVHLCRDLETFVLGTPAGVQDYIPALYSNAYYQLYIISLSCGGGVSWRSKPVPKLFLKEHFLLIDTKITHHSGQNNWEVLKRFIDKDAFILEGVRLLRDNALRMVDICDKGDFSAMGSILHKEYRVRKRYFPAWMNQQVEVICQALAEREGVEAVKLCGAGGGGCALVFVKNKPCKQALINWCARQNIAVLKEAF